MHELLAKHGIDLKRHGLGNHKARCPRCSHLRRHKADLCLSVLVGQGREPKKDGDKENRISEIKKEIAVLRGNKLVVPRGETRLEDGDVVVALVNTDEESQLRLALLGA